MVEILSTRLFVCLYNALDAACSNPVIQKFNNEWLHFTQRLINQTDISITFIDEIFNAFDNSE